MTLELINQHAAKIILATEPGDSINQISKKTGSSYGWTHKWIQKLDEAEIIDKQNGIEIKDKEAANKYLELAQTVYTKNLDLNEAYLLPNFSGLNYRYSKIDAVYIWTKGGYQITRDKNDYPIIIDVLEKDLGQWKDFLEAFKMDYAVGDRKKNNNGIYYLLYPKQRFESKWTENYSVTPLDETVEYAKKYIYNFQPALEMLDEMYDLALDVEYTEYTKP